MEKAPLAESERSMMYVSGSIDKHQVSIQLAFSHPKSGLRYLCGKAVDTETCDNGLDSDV